MRTCCLAGLCILSGARLSPPADTAREESAAQDAHVAAIRLAITDLLQTFCARSPKGPEYWQRLDVLEQKLDQPEPRSAEELKTARETRPGPASSFTLART